MFSFVSQNCSLLLRVAFTIMLAREHKSKRIFMATKLKAQVQRAANGKIRIEISRDEFERFCNTFGFFRKDFLKLLRESEIDHRAGRVTKRESLFELMSE